MDPLFEKYPDFSPYNYCAGNPVKLVDPDGTSTHTSEDGSVIAIYDDNDLGVYKHTADDLKNFDSNTMLVNGYPLLNDNTKWVGETWTPFGFADFSKYENGVLKPDLTSKIEFDSNWATDKMTELESLNPNFAVYAVNARGKAKWDYKWHTPGHDNASRPGYGSLLYGKYASARDLGNFGAGVIAAKSVEPKSFFDYGYGSYNKNGNNAIRTFFSVIFDMMLISPDPTLESQVLNDPITTSRSQNLGNKRINQMMHGEDKLSQMGIDTGYNYIKK